MAYFLLEIGAEEIPDWMIEPALEDLRTKLSVCVWHLRRLSNSSRMLRRAASFYLPKICWSSAPRCSISRGRSAISLQVKRPLNGFARKQGTTVERSGENLRQQRRAIHLPLSSRRASRPLKRSAEKLPEVIAGIHFPKAMYWTKKSDIRFIRPIRWIVALLEDQVVPFEIAGITSGNRTRGHRVLGSREPLRRHGRNLPTDLAGQWCDRPRQRSPAAHRSRPRSQMFTTRRGFSEDARLPDRIPDSDSRHLRRESISNCRKRSSRP